MRAMRAVRCCAYALRVILRATRRVEFPTFFPDRWPQHVVTTSALFLVPAQGRDAGRQGTPVFITLPPSVARLAEAHVF